MHFTEDFLKLSCFPTAIYVPLLVLCEVLSKNNIISLSLLVNHWDQNSYILKMMQL